MRLLIDLDIALFCVRHKLDKECRAYYFFRELSKYSSGYINRRKAIYAYMENTGASYGTANRRVNALLDLGWAIQAGGGNIHINGLYRVKTLLASRYGENQEFVWRRRSCTLDLFVGAKKEGLGNFKAQLSAALTADKLNRNIHLAKARVRSMGRMSKAEIGKALANTPNIECYAHSLKCIDWSLSAGTVNRRKRQSEKLGLELYDYQKVEGLAFTTKAEAIEAAIALEYTGSNYKKVFYRDGFFCLRAADKIRTRMELSRRGKPNHLKSKDLQIKVSGSMVLIDQTKDLTKKQRSSVLFVSNPFIFSTKIDNLQYGSSSFLPF